MEVVVTAGAKGDGGGGNSWSYKACKVPVRTSQHQVFLQAGCPSCLPNRQHQSTEG